ncbi:unnamed protein product, partial [Schistocephalus solidus]|uniref:NTP_transferase domain-containing protein n=1 Tax=Schistocephalus solidus TaxID=70667 RepID=A0A183SBR1_SCHSO
MICLSVGAGDRLSYQHVLLISPPDENIVQQLPVSRPGVYPGHLMPYQEAEECVGKQETVFCTRSQKKEAVIVAAAENMGTQHSLPGSVFRPDAGVE